MTTVKIIKNGDGTFWRVRGNKGNGYFVEYRKPGQKNYTAVGHFIRQSAAEESIEECSRKTWQKKLRSGY